MISLYLLQIAQRPEIASVDVGQSTGYLKTIEQIGVAVIILFQLYIFCKTWRQIFLYKNIFPKSDGYQITHAGFLPEFLKLPPKKILDNFDAYLEKSEPKVVQPEITDEAGNVIWPAAYGPDERLYVDLIDYDEVRNNKVTEKIFYSLNTYLLRNRNAASDFHLMKDVVERNTDAVESDIQQSVSIPLYLGLLGTFSGIVFGLFQISDFNFSSDTEALNNAITLLLGGVQIAMLASFAGLLLTVLHTGIFFKGARALIEDRKNELYTFMQTELLPLLNQGINSTLDSFQRNMHQFNDEFKVNLSKLDSVMGKNYDSLKAQEKVLNTLQKMDIAEFAKANLKVLQALQYSVEKFAEFNRYLSGMNELVTSTGNVSIKLNEIINRTNNFDNLGKQILSMFSENQKLISFLQNHYDALDTSHQLITKAVNDVDETLATSLNLLKDFTQERINDIQKITLKEIDLMREAYPEKWKKLDNLSYLEPVSKNISEMKMSTAGQMASMTNEIKLLQQSMTKINETLLNLNNHIPWYQSLWNKMKKTT